MRLHRRKAHVRKDGTPVKSSVVRTSGTVAVPSPAPVRGVFVSPQLHEDPVVQELSVRAAAEAHQRMLADLHLELEANEYLVVDSATSVAPRTTVFTPQGHTLNLSGVRVADRASLLIVNENHEINETRVSECVFRDDATVSLTPTREPHLLVVDWGEARAVLRDGSSVRTYERQCDRRLSPARNRLAPQLHQLTVTGSATVSGATSVTGSGYTLVEGNAKMVDVTVVAHRTHISESKSTILPHPTLCDIRVGGDAVVYCDLTGHSIWVKGDAVIPAEATVVSGAQIYSRNHIATVALASGKIATVHPQLRGTTHTLINGPGGLFVLPWLDEEVLDESPQVGKPVVMEKREVRTPFGSKMVADVLPFRYAVNNASTATSTERSLLDAIGQRMLTLP